MGDQKWLDEYSGQTTDQLIALEGEYRTDSLVVAFEQAVDQKAAEIGTNRLTSAERVILAVEALEREVNNGGYNQLFVNSSKEYAAVMVASLRAIGCPKTADITKKAIDELNIADVLSVESSDNAMEEENELREKKLSECDDLYYNAGEPIADHLFEYIKANRNQIKLK